MRKFLILLFLGVSFLPIMAEKNESNVLDAIITECVNKTGGYIGLQDTIDNGVKITYIVLPEGIGHYEITASLKSLIISIEEYYKSIKPWKVLDNGVLACVNVDKESKEKILMLEYDPQNSQFLIIDAKKDDFSFSFPTTSFSKLINFVEWGVVAYTGGFIREESDYEDFYQVAVQLQSETTVSSLITDLEPLYNCLDQIYYCGRPWQIGDDGVLECEFFDQSEKHFIQFYYFSKPQTLVINFIQGNNK